MKIFTCLLYFIIIFLCLLIIPQNVIADFTKYTNNPILSVGSQGIWDESFVHMPYVIWTDQIGTIFYGGQNHNMQRAIGYASISSNISGEIVLEKYPFNPILNQGFISMNDWGVDDPSVIVEKNNNSSIYKMWFKNTFGPPNYIFKLHYSTSQDGKNWNTSIPLDLPLPTNINSAVGPSVLYRNDINKYQMWFGGRNNNDYWSILYAESSNGITWTNITRVLEPEISWEGRNINSPSIIFKNDIYYMFYDGDKNIFSATSVNGIHWSKNKTKPVLTPDPLSSFDNIRLLDPFILEKNNKYYLFYTGVNPDHYNIGLASSDDLPPVIIPTGIISITPSPSPTPSLTPTPIITLTPSPTITPTPTLSPTATPTPTSSLFSPIVIIPGMGASWNARDIFTCSQITTGHWELAPYVSLYQPLISTLTQNARLKLNEDVFLYTYDWRQTLDQQATDFKNYLNDLLTNKPVGTKVKIIGHSFGGLVARSYLAQNPDSSKVDSLITIGTPHQGAVLAYPIWEKGEIWDSDLLTSIAATQLLNHCRYVRSLSLINWSAFRFRRTTAKDVVQILIPSIQQLLPTFDYLRQNQVVKKTDKLYYQNNWLDQNQVPQNHYNISLFTLSGTKISTLSFLDVANPDMRDQFSQDWVDGKPTGKEYSLVGDGTILVNSSQLKDATNEVLNGNHGFIVSDAKAITKILEFLKMYDVKPAEVISIPEESSNLVMTISSDKPTIMNLTDPDNKTSQTQKNILVIYNPQEGLYKLQLTSYENAKITIYVSNIKKSALPETKEVSYSVLKGRPLNLRIDYKPSRFAETEVIRL